MVDYLAEIPLPSRILAAPTAKLACGAAPAMLPSFVAGPENRLLAETINHLLALAPAHTRVGETLADVAIPLQIGAFQPFPLTLYGPSGVGKTHLLQGLVRHWQRQRGAEAACYTTAADFRRSFNEAIGDNRVSSFRDECRGRRLYAIDDIHRMPNDDYLMQELRHMLDSCEESGHLVVVTAPRPIDTISNFSPDLRSRFAAGLSLQIANPGSAARTRIIHLVSTALGRDLPPEVANRLANGVSGAATQIFGALFALWAATGLPGSDGVRHQEYLDTVPRRQPSLQEIMAIVAKYTRVSQTVLKSGSRRRSAVFARALVVYLARQLSGASYEQIGRALGGRDHSTILYNYKKIDRDLACDMPTQQTITDLRRALTG